MESDEFDAAVADLEVRLERLRSLYEQYFLGIERIEPTVARKDVDRRFWQLRKIKVRNTARRFKLQNLVSRYNTLQQHWMKVCRQIENGTYIRHLARAQRRFVTSTTAAEAEDSNVPGPQRWVSDDGPTPEQVRRAFSALANAEPRRAARPDPSRTDADDLDAPAPMQPPPLPGKLAPASSVHPAATGSAHDGEPPNSTRAGTTKTRPKPPPRRSSHTASASASKARPSATTREGLTDDSIRSLYDEFLRQRALYEPNSKSVSAPALAQSLRATEAKLKAKHGARRVEFRVEHKDGRVVIKPTVRR